MSSTTRPRFAVDLGTTWTSAARNDGQPVNLGDRGAAMPSVVARSDAGFVVGHAAERVLATSPERGVREIKRRFGDTTPVVLDGQPFTPDALTVELLRGAASAAGINPTTTTAVLTHPANWGEYKLDLLRNVAAQAGFADVELISEPAAAALHYAHSGRLHEGDTVAVYDFGGGTFDAVVVRLTAAGPVQLGAPQGLERLGGIDIDQVVFSHVAAAVGGALSALDRNDPDVRRAILALRAECTVAKEQLSSDGEATINVVAHGLSTQVRITRDEMESALRPRIADTITSLERAVASAGLTFGDLAGIVLVGGSSRIPLVGEMVAAGTGRPLLIDADMKLVVVQGAAMTVAGTAAASALTPSSPAPSAPSASVPARDTDPAAPTETKETTMSDTPNSDGSSSQGGAIPPPPPKKDEDKGSVSAATLIGGAAVAAAAVAGGVLFGDDIVEAVTGGDDEAPTTPDTPADTRTADRAAREAGDETMDAFDEVAAAPVVPLPPPAPAANFGGGGSDNGGGGGQQQRAPRPESSPAAPQQPTDSSTAPAIDPEFEGVRSTLLDRIENLDLGDGVSPEDVQTLKDQLRDTVDRFQPNPGQSAEAALADLRTQYDERVQDFTQDQKIEALIDEQMRDNQADAADPTSPNATDPIMVDPSAIDPTIDPSTGESLPFQDTAMPDPVVTLTAPVPQTMIATEDVMSDPDDGGEVASDPDDGGEVVQPGVINVNPTLDIRTDSAVNVGDVVASDPDDGGEIAGGLIDDFDSVSDTFQEQVAAVDLPLADLVAAGEDLFGEGIASGEQAPGLHLPDLAPLATDIVGAGEALLDGNISGAVGGIQDAAQDYAVVSDDVVDVPYEQDVDDTVTDFADDPVDSARDTLEEAEGSVAGIADDNGL